MQFISCASGGARGVRKMTVTRTIVQSLSLLIPLSVFGVGFDAFFVQHLIPWVRSYKRFCDTTGAWEKLSSRYFSLPYLPLWIFSADLLFFHRVYIKSRHLERGLTMVQMSIKISNLKCRLFLKNWPIKVLGGRCLYVWGPLPPRFC